MARPSVEQWEVRQMMLAKLETQPQNLRFASTAEDFSSSIAETSKRLHDFGGELQMYGSEWDKKSAIEDLKAASEEYNAADLTEDPQAPLKALISDTARMTASISNLSSEQAGAFFENFTANSKGVFADPRAEEMLHGNNYPKGMIVEAARTLTMGMGDVSRRMMIEKAGQSIRASASLSAEVNRPKSAYEVAHNRSFDAERAHKADPFAHLRNREIKIERNEESKLDPHAPLEPK